MKLLSRLKFVFFTVLMAASAPLFSQTRSSSSGALPSGMQTLADSILEIFTGGFVKTILIIFFCATAVTYGFNKDNEKMKRNCIAIGVAIAMIAMCSFIVGAVYTASGASS